MCIFRKHVKIKFDLLRASSSCLKFLNLLAVLPSAPFASCESDFYKILTSVLVVDLTYTQAGGAMEERKMTEDGGGTAK